MLSFLPSKFPGVPRPVEVEHRSVREEFGCMPHMVAVDAAGAVQHLDCSSQNWEPGVDGEVSVT